MQRHHGQLQPKSKQQQGQHPGLGSWSEGRCRQGLKTEAHGAARSALTQPTEGQYPSKQAEARNGAIKQEARGSSCSSLTSPDSHQQRGGDQHQFKCQHKQQGIAGEEGAHHPEVGGKH